MKTWTPAATVKQTTCLCRDTGGKGTLPAQHTTFNTLDNWAIKPPPNQKGKGPERKGYRVMARNMYTIHSVTSVMMNKWLSDTWTVSTSGGGWPLVRQLIFDNTSWINLNKANYYNNQFNHSDSTALNFWFVHSKYETYMSVCATHGQIWSFNLSFSFKM